MSVRTMSIGIARLVLILVVAAGARPALAAGPIINPGNWEITMHTTEPIDSPPMTSVSCIAADAIARIGPPVSRADDECKVAGGGSLQGGLNYVVVCPHQGRTARTKITFSGDTYSGLLVIEHAGGPTFKQTIEGRRLGDCPSQP